MVRDAVDGDLDASAQIIAVEAGGPVLEWRQRFAEVLADPDRIFLVAVVHGRVVGFGQARRVERPEPVAPGAPPPGWYLSGVTVVAEFRRRGIGAQLTRARLARLRAGGATVVYCVAEPENAATLELHQRVGFVDVGEVRLPGRGRPLRLQRLDLVSTA